MPLTAGYARKMRVTFNSLFEMPGARKDLQRGRRDLAFNSLFEMLEDVLSEAEKHFPRAPFNSLFEMPKRLLDGTWHWFTGPLSILYLRCVLMRYITFNGITDLSILYLRCPSATSRRASAQPGPLSILYLRCPPRHSA